MNTRRWTKRDCLILAVFIAMQAPFVASAQSDGSVPPSDTPPATLPVVVEMPAAATSSPSNPASSAISVPVGSGAGTLPSGGSAPAPASAGSAPTPRDVIPPTVEVPPMLEATVEDVPEQGSWGSGYLWPVLGVLALLPFGFFAANLLKKKPKQTKESDRRCFDIKSILEEKLKELTDVRAQVEGKIKKVAKEQLREAVSGTATGDALVRLEKLEAEYNRLKKLLEECTIDAERYKYRGILVENSLLDTSILERLQIVQTRDEEGHTLHDIRLGSGLIEDIQKHMADGPWYCHVWKPGHDEVTVVFKTKIFTIIHSDTSTLSDAIGYGKSIGIPEDRLDFRID